MYLVTKTLHEICDLRESAKDMFAHCLDETTNFKDIPTEILNAYPEFIAFFETYEAEPAEEQVLTDIVQLFRSMSESLKLDALDKDDYINHLSEIKGKSTSVSKYIDTPETEADYSGDAHTTNITKSEQQSDNIAYMQLLKPLRKDLIDKFRRYWLLDPKYYL